MSSEVTHNVRREWFSTVHLLKVHEVRSNLSANGRVCLSSPQRTQDCVTLALGAESVSIVQPWAEVKRSIFRPTAIG